ncbi:hypothetical protein FRB99_005574 [Tulasnella sp. 403]|nr:hypothetical protein FRB99_005574 [Tulasnella sp. 403]
MVGRRWEYEGYGAGLHDYNTRSLVLLYSSRNIWTSLAIDPSDKTPLDLVELTAGTIVKLHLTGNNEAQAICFLHPEILKRLLEFLAYSSEGVRFESLMLIGSAMEDYDLPDCLSCFDDMLSRPNEENPEKVPVCGKSSTPQRRRRRPYIATE